MSDAYDALIFLAPLDRLHFSATADFFYTEACKEEVKRRIVVHGTDLSGFLQQQGAPSLDIFVETLADPKPVSPNHLLPD